jgi:ANTAR domain
MVMERFNIDADQAFNLLVRLSQDSNTPVRTIADDITRGDNREAWHAGAAVRIG